MTQESEERQPLKLVSELMSRLHDRAVRFCHWKSNRGLPEALAGHEDLDVLTRRSDAAAFGRILADLGFRQLRSGPDRRFPGIEDHIGYDEPSGRIVHLQLHFRLVLGEPLIKNYLFPVEKLLLEEIDQSRFSPSSMPVPSRETELAIFVMRILIKFKPYHLLKPAVRERIRDEARQEIDFLGGVEGLNRAAVSAAKLFPGFTPALFEECALAFSEDAPSITVLSLRRRAMEVLRNYRRRGSVEAYRALAHRRSYLARWQRAHRRPPKRVPANGGILVAFVGPDGSGKSTAIDQVDQWLAPFLNVTRGHMGKPPKAIWSRVSDRVVSVAERFAGVQSAPARTPIGEEIGGGRLMQTLYAWQLARLAEDRLRESRRVRAQALRGDVVLCDRYPLPGLVAMESEHGSRLARANNGLARRFVERERRAYESIARPDLTVGLRVSPDVAAERQPGDGREFVRFRANEFFEYTSVPREKLVPIDAMQSVDDVSRAIRRTIWKSL